MKLYCARNIYVTELSLLPPHTARSLEDQKSIFWSGSWTGAGFFLPR